MAPVVRISFTLCTLALLAMGVMPRTVARPSEKDTSPQLEITSSIKLGGPIFGDRIGPFATGQKLTLTCSTDFPDPVTLSWWEDEKELEAVGKDSYGIVSSSFTMNTLQLHDSGRRFTCRDLVTGTAKYAELHVVEVNKVLLAADFEETVGIIWNHRPLDDEEAVQVSIGENINLQCVVRGYNPSPGSWWEGEEKLHAASSSSEFASSSQLLLRAVRTSDSGRRLSCRARGGQLSTTVVLDVKEGVQLPPAHVSTTAGTRPTIERMSTVNVNKKPALETVIAGVSVTLCVIMIIIISVILKVCRKNSQRENFPSPMTDSSSSDTSVLNSPRSLDPLDLPPLSYLLPRPQPVEGGDEAASSGGRMLAVMPEDRDHSYYYPDLINNSYYYPKITD